MGQAVNEQPHLGIAATETRAALLLEETAHCLWTGCVHCQHSLSSVDLYSVKLKLSLSQSMALHNAKYKLEYTSGGTAIQRRDSLVGAGPLLCSAQEHYLDHLI